MKKYITPDVTVVEFKQNDTVAITTNSGLQPSVDKTLTVFKS